MNLNEIMVGRRSIRSYKEGTTIEKSLLEELVKAAQLAPTWKNSQTGRYYIVVSPEKLEAVKNCLPEYNHNNCANAPALIVTAFEKTRSGFDREGNPDNECGDEWGAYDLGLQNQNLLLKATELGLGTLVMGLRDSEALRKELNIPDSQEVMSVISVGYADIAPEMPKRKELEKVATFF